MADHSLAPAAASSSQPATHTELSKGFSSAPQARSASPSSNPATAAPAGHSFRRAVTVDLDAPHFRRRPPLNPLSTDEFLEHHAPPPPPLPPPPSVPGPRRRSSTFSDYSLNEARRSLQSSTDDILNPSGKAIKHHEGSHWHSLPLAFALLPAVGGILFQNGSAVITDVMLLGLASVFLHWTVTQPWIWYHSAQEVRIQDEFSNDMAIVDELDVEGHDSQSHAPPPAPTKSKTLDDVPEVPEDDATEPAAKPVDPARKRVKEDALRELYGHEVLALLSCFVAPMIGSYLLHAIRSQLSRPSEGLVSNFNLTIFLLAAEIRPLSHLIKLVQARTTHLQRLVHSDPFHEPAVTSSQLDGLAQRLQELESRMVTEVEMAAAAATPNGDSGAKTKSQEAAMVREVRNAIQPELDALNRAVRRYEKKATVLAFQTESRLGAIDARLNDAIALAAAAAKNSASHGSVVGWFIDTAIWTVLLPFNTVVSILTLPLRTASSLLGRNQRPAGRDRSQQRAGRSGKGDGSGSGGGGSQARRSSSDRMPARITKR